MKKTVPVLKTAFVNLILLMALAITTHARAGTWSEVFSDDFKRPDSPGIGNNWSDPSGVAKILDHALTITVPAGGTGLDVRVSRPVSEAGLDQRIEASFIITATNDGLSHGAYVRGKSLVISGQEIYPVMLVNVRHGGVLSVKLDYKGGAGAYPGTSGTDGFKASFAPVTGHSYTLAVQVMNNFPCVLLATLTDNDTSKQVAGITYSDSGQYGSLHMSPDFKTPGEMGLALEGAAGKSISYSKVVTYAWSEAGPLSASSVTPVFKQHDGNTYLASPDPAGGKGPYGIRWYRGATADFTPPMAADGSGPGSGTWIGNIFEQVDAHAPAGVSNWSIYYRAVYFDSGANAATGIPGKVINTNSPTSKGYAIPFWIGDSITAGYATSTRSGNKAPSAYAETWLKNDALFTQAFTMPISGAVSNFGLSGKTSTDMLAQLPHIVGQTRFIGATVTGITLGTNDSKDSVATASAQYKANIQAIVTALKEERPDMKIVLNKPLWFKPDTGYGPDFSTASLSRISQYQSMLDQLADGTHTVVGSLKAYDEIMRCGWTGTTGKPNVPNAVTTWPPAPAGGQSYLVDGLHPYDGGSEMIGKTEWGPNAENALLGHFTQVGKAASAAAPR